MKNTFLRVWRVLRWPLGILVLLYAGLVLYRIPAVGEKERTAQVVAQIHAQKITLADVMGRALPSMPDEQENNATVAGIDKNNNGVRDDVELAIFKKYPNSAKIRAAELQYAMALQTELERVFNSETLVASIQEADRAYLCLGDISSKGGSVFDQRKKEIEDLVFDIEKRIQKREQVFEYMTSYGDVVGKSNCDIDSRDLPN